MPPKQLSPKLLSWASDIEQNTIDQAAATSRLPFIDGHVALMPDAHLGMGSTVGSVIPTRGAIIPAAIGVDIGCGMVAAATGLGASDLPDDLSGLLSRIEQAIPAGMGKGHTSRREIPESILDNRPEGLTTRQEDKIQTQFGSLGGGNHFVEVCLDETDNVWIVLHSGSRGIGKELAEVHIGEARGLMKDWFIELEDPNLAYLVQGTHQFVEYIMAMTWAQDYAAGNRRAMMTAALRAFFGETRIPFDYRNTEIINCHHNFTELEHHNGRNMWITRKGAIKADRGDLGIIPGSMGTGTFIVEGLGNPASYNSCSHGAGRRMSRTQARREVTAAQLTEAMGDRTWQSANADQLVDESPMAYKDIGQVMADQEDLVRIKHRLRSVLNYKGLDESPRRRRKKMTQAEWEAVPRKESDKPLDTGS